MRGAGLEQARTFRPHGFSNEVISSLTPNLLLSQMSNTSGTEPASAKFDEMYELTISGIRELGAATVDAQIRSIEMLRDHARDGINRAKAFKIESERA